MAEVVETPTPSDVGRMGQEEFAEHFFGVKLEDVGKEQDAPTADVADDVVDEPATDDAPAEDAPEDEVTDDAEKPAEPEVKLPFAVKDGEGAEVAAAALQSMTVTLKADGKVETIPLADVVRRAQSEPAAQKQAREYRSKAESLETKWQEEAALSQQRAEIALAMLRDPDLYLKYQQDLEQYDAPEARARRAEDELAATKREQVEAQERQQREAVTVSFFQDTVIPQIAALTKAYPSVSDDEVWGRFDRETSHLKNTSGIIPPDQYGALTAYLAGPFAKFMETRHADHEAKTQAQQKAERKAQLAAQKLKNESAGRSKPLGAIPSLRGDDGSSTPPRTYKEAQKQGIDTLLANLQ